MTSERFLILVAPFLFFSCEPARVIGNSTEDEATILIFAAGQMNGDFGLGGGTLRENVDELCDTAFNNLSGDFDQSTVRAFISTSATDEIADMQTNYSIPSDRAVVSPNDTSIADDWNELVSGTLNNTLQNGGVANGHSEWWSGTENDGTFSAFNCDSWSSNGDLESGKTGLTVGTTTFLGGGGTDPCDNSLPYLICIAY